MEMALRGWGLNGPKHQLTGEGEQAQVPGAGGSFGGWEGLDSW